MPNDAEGGDDLEFLSQVEDIPDYHEEGATNILEMGAGQMTRKTASSGGVPLGFIDPNSVSTPRRKVAAKPKPWAQRGDYGSIYSRTRGSAMASVDFTQTPPPKEEIREKVAGPFEQTTPDEGHSPSPETNQGFVGKTKTPKRLSAKDEEATVEKVAPVEIARRNPSSEGEGSIVQGWNAKMAQLQVVGQKDGTAMMTYAEFKMSGKGFTQEAYMKYLQSRCYACADQVESGVMCHECYAAVHQPDLPKIGKGASAKEIVVQIKKEADSKSLLMPRMTQKTEKFDWDKNRSAEKTDGWGSTEGTKEKDYKLHDADHYREQTGEILDDPLVHKEKVTLTRGNEGKKKSDDKKAAKEGTIDKEIKVEVEPLKKNPMKKGPPKAGPLQRGVGSQKPEKFPDARRSQSDERLIDYDGSKPQDYVTEFNFKGAEQVKKDYPYQLMKAQGKEASIDFLPKSDSQLPTSVPTGLPILRDRGGVSIFANGNGRTLADELGAQAPQQASYALHDKVVSASFQGVGEVSDFVYGDRGEVSGCIVETKAGLVTVAASSLKKAIMDLTEDQKQAMTTAGLDPNNEDHKKKWVDMTTGKVARYKVASKANVMEVLHGKIGTKFSHKGRTALDIPGLGKFFFKDEDLIRID